MFLCGRKEEFSRTATGLKKKKKEGNTVHCFEVETTPGTKLFIPQIWGSARPRQYILTNRDKPTYCLKVQKGIT